MVLLYLFFKKNTSITNKNAKEKARNSSFFNFFKFFLKKCADLYRFCTGCFGKMVSTKEKHSRRAHGGGSQKKKQEENFT